MKKIQLHLYLPGQNGLRNWHRDPDVSNLRDSMRKKIDDFLSAKTSFGMEQRAFLVTSLESGLFAEAATKEEYVSKETLNDRLQILLQCEDNVAAGHGQEVSSDNLEPLSLLGTTAATSIASTSSVQQLQIHWKISNYCFKVYNLGDSAKTNSNKFEDLLPFPKRMKVDKSCLVALTTNQTKTIHKIDAHNIFRKKFELNVDCKAVERQTRIEFISLNDQETNPESPRIKCLSLFEFLTIEQIKDHISSLHRWADQDFSDGIKESDMNACQLCRSSLLWLAPQPKYCSSCAAPIKHAANYYRTLADVSSSSYLFCSTCYNRSKGEIISIYGVRILKKMLHKRKNDPEIEESWVQCDTCNRWQHQVCALFNEDQQENTEYKCPLCWLKEEEHDYKHFTFSAKDLPRTRLSNHIEERLFRRLKQERKERARVAGKCFDEVPGAEDLTVRIVLSMKKKIAVKKELLDTLKDEDYPTEFPYTLKLILLFQKIEGVDVCIFSMYVQEYGSECSQPNQRCVYISYIDSIKYFTPTIQTSSGEALRTFVFHEILIGYLDFVKKRGFAECYIWACPPLKGDDFFFYCHPETQKTPKSNKLRQWYHAMLRKAANEEIVVNYTNFYDRFFIPTREASCKITAARLPCFEGDYWSGAVEDFVKMVETESKENSKKMITKTTLKVMGHTNSSDADTKDFLLMRKVGQAILPVKQDYMVISLQFGCSHCHGPIVSKKHWFCNQCNNFHLCERCHDAEQEIYWNDTHISVKGEQHKLSRVPVDVPNDTKDEDDTLEDNLLDDRSKFLRFCQDNNYQFDTLRRAKHSSMMILYRLRHLIAPTVGTSCHFCHGKDVVDQTWLCKACPEFSVCSTCYREKGGSCHIHELTRSPSMDSRSKNSKEEPPERLKMELLQLLQHANQCQATKTDRCSHEHCSDIRTMFNHARMCRVRAPGGCIICKKVWYALNLHATSCAQQDCRMPHCGWRGRGIRSERFTVWSANFVLSEERFRDENPRWKIMWSSSSRTSQDVALEVGFGDSPERLGRVFEFDGPDCFLWDENDCIG